MPKRLPEAKRKAILADITPGSSRNVIARKHGVSASFVGKVAAEAGLDDVWNRTHTEKAARAKAVDNKARRAQLESDLLDDAQHFRQRARAPYEVVVSTVQGAEVITLSEPPLTDVRSALTAIGICIDKGLAIERHDVNGDGADHAKSMLGRLFSGLAEAVGTEPPETPPDEG